jgi:hypothetical protein
MHPLFCMMRLGAGAQTDNSLLSSKYLAPPAVIMTLAARGFVLWFANLALLLYLINSLPAIHQHQKVIFLSTKSKKHYIHTLRVSLSMSQAVCTFTFLAQDTKEQEKRLAQEDFYGPPAPGYESYNQGFVMNEGVR